MLNSEQILEKVLRGTTDYKHRNNPKRLRIIHLADSWALLWTAGGTYGCGYGPNYVSGEVRLILLPEHLSCNGGFAIWDTARDRQGAATKKKLARIIEVVTDCISQDRDTAVRVARQILEWEFCKHAQSKRNGR